MPWGFGRQAFAIACFLFLTFVPGVVFAESILEPNSQSEYIRDFSVHLQIEKNGRLSVMERIEYHFGIAERHGIYRDLPVDYVTKLGVKRSLPITIESVTDDRGVPQPYEKSREGGLLRVKVGDAERLVSGEQVYVIRYTVENAIGFFDAYDELYWNVTGHDWTVPIMASSATMVLPDGAETKQLSCYRGPLGSTEDCAIESLSQKESRARAGALLSAGSGMTVAVGFSKGVVQEPSFPDQILGFLTRNPFAILPFIVFGFMFRRWWRDGRDPMGRGTVVPEYEVPGGLSPLHVAVLQDGRLTGKEIPAAIIDLAVKGHLVIERVTDNGRIFDTTDYALLETVERPATGSIELALFEALFTSADSRTDAAGIRKLLATPQARLLPGFLKRSIAAGLPKETVATGTTPRSVKVSELKNKFYTKIPELQKHAVTDLVSQKLLTKSPQEVWGKYALWGTVLLMGAFFLIPILELSGANAIAILVTLPIYFVFVYLMPRVTRDGAIMKERLLGLKDYLQIAEKRRLEFHNAPEKTPALFEKLLPAALLLGVSDIWAREFADLTLAEPEWYRGGSVSHFSAASFATDLGGFNTAAASSLASAPSSSGSGGGGFSGGGSGGGGGGSW